MRAALLRWIRGLLPARLLHCLRPKWTVLVYYHDSRIPVAWRVRASIEDVCQHIPGPGEVHDGRMVMRWEVAPGWGSEEVIHQEVP